MFDPDGTIYTDFNSAATIGNTPNIDGFPAYYDDPTKADYAYYYLDSPTSISTFESVVKYIPSLEYYKVTTSNDLYKRLTAPVQGKATLSSLMTVILLLAVDEKKSRVILQVFVETLIPVSIAFCVAIFSIGFISQQVCNKILANGASIVEQQDKQNMQDVNYILNKASQFTIGGEFDSSTATPIEKVNVTVTPATVGDFAGCSFLIVLICMLFPLLNILRLST